MRKNDYNETNGAFIAISALQRFKTIDFIFLKTLKKLNKNSQG